ncbi:hypothetical protein EDD37DRAFT_653735 [Exophiala viscosa]|uniref:Uncharacterized protein n=1 Tax=Exophiala viscosa TaxID=2486360 RepID=A0AAN6DQB7_9EURO|nr:hypothetical protein EDD36DRAFT_66470 [Exophiala viscosa]KAI1620679.1 hypothetical protein EDD37DRAFT_653735 [Exophiala viscosa]
MSRFREHDYLSLNPSIGEMHGEPIEMERKGPYISREQASRDISPNAALVYKHDIEQPSHRPTGGLDTHWDPPFLRRWVLALFAVLFVAIIVGLQAIYSVSVRDQGIASSDDNKHYLWTYGPTAVFVIFTVLWRQVDYAAKSIQPWAEMAKGPQPVQDSLLLDYVTPLQLFSLWKSLRKGHVAVASSIAVFFLIKIITIVSTSTFELISIQRSGVATTMSFNTTFNGSSFNHAASVDARAVISVYGANQYNVSLPVGTSDTYAVQTFSPANGFINGSLTYTATVDVFSASLVNCTTGTINYTISRDRNYNTPVSGYYNTSVSLPDCEIHNAYLRAPEWYYQTNVTKRNFGYKGSLQNVSCSNLAEDDPNRDRYMISVAYSEGFSQDAFTMLNSSNVVCTPTYSIQQGAVTLDTNGNIQSVDLIGKPRTLDGVSGVDIAKGVLTSASNSYAISNDDSSSDEVVLDPFMTLMREASDNFQTTQLLDPAYLTSVGNKAFGQVSAQLARIYLLTTPSTDAASTVDGTVSEFQNRLVARAAPVHAMQGIAGGMLVFTLVMLFWTPRGVVPRAIDSIAAVAAILARSPLLEARLRGTGHMSLEQLRELLSPYRFMTCIGYEDGARSFSIRMSTASEVHELNNDEDSMFHNVKWIQPFILRRIAIGLTMLASVAAIIVLEVLLSQSRANDGLGNVPGQNDATRYSWLYVPVLVFVLLGTLFNIMDFEIESAESYHAMAKGFCNASSSMLWYPLRHISLHATWNGLRHSRFALTAASASAVLAPFLTIVVSGLFISQATVKTTPLQATALNWFNTTTLSYSTSSSNIPSLVIEGNMSYPQWTYDELAIPHIKVNQSDEQTLLQNTSISISTPAIRASVSCYVVPQERLLQIAIPDTEGINEVNISMAAGCGNSGFADRPYEYLITNPSVPVNVSGYFGATEVLVGQYHYCPTIALFYGHMTENNVMDNFTAYLCTQGLERVNANVTFDLPDMTISTAPIVDDGSAVNFSSYREEFPTLLSLNLTATDVLDTAFEAMVYGRDGVPMDELTNHTKLIDTFTHFYRQYMAQEVDEFLRADFRTLSNNATETVANPLQATYTDARNMRVVQSSLSTHLLVGVLAALLICAATIFVTIDMRHVLPKPMGSVAAVASLLAGSRIVDETSGLIPKGSEFWSDNDWEKSGIWQGEMFRMGWWGKFDEPINSWRGQQDMVTGVYSVGGDESENPLSASDTSSVRSFRIDARPRGDI